MAGEPPAPPIASRPRSAPPGRPFAPTRPARHGGRQSMPANGIALVLAALIVLVPAAASSQTRLKIFDAHLHYNHEPDPFYRLDQVLEIFRRNDVAGIIANS